MDRDDLEREVERTREALAQWSGVPEASRGEQPLPDRCPRCGGAVERHPITPFGVEPPIFTPWDCVLGAQCPGLSDEALDAEVRSHLNDTLRSVWAPIIAEQLRMPMLLLGDGWPRRWVLFPWLDRWERTVRWWKRDLHDWWRARPEFLGGDGLPEY